MIISDLLYQYVLPHSTTPILDIALLMAHVLDKSLEFIYSEPNYKISKSEYIKFYKLYKRRRNHEPMAYILQRKNFWSIELFINNNVLIPRPETELLVDITLQLYSNNTNITLVDLGTGSGAIALALGKERPKWNILATDICMKALQIAHYNSMKLNITNVKFIQGNWFDMLSPHDKFNIIISNPPYISSNDLKQTDADLKFEPNIALESSSNGLKAISHIIAQARNFLYPAGKLLLEHGYNQNNTIREIFIKYDYNSITSYKDLNGISRAMIATFN